MRFTSWCWPTNYGRWKWGGCGWNWSGSRRKEKYSRISRYSRGSRCSEDSRMSRDSRRSWYTVSFDIDRRTADTRCSGNTRETRETRDSRWTRCSKCGKWYRNDDND